MSTVPRKPVPPRPSAEDDPFFYGFRPRVEIVNGKRKLVNVPLTREDVLHPQEGDHIAQNDCHGEDVRYLTGIFKARLAGEASAVVLSDVNVYWPDPVLDHHCPDVAVLLGAPHRIRRFSYSVADDGVIPELLVEVTSPSTRDGDLTTKRRQYYQAGVPFYVIVNELPAPADQPRRLQLIGYRRGVRGYVHLRPRRQRLWLETVQLWLGIERRGENEFAICYDPEGRRFETLLEITQAREEAEERADSAAERAEAERRRAETAERRLHELEAELRRLRGES
jgi:Uma2 family endonuclease